MLISLQVIWVFEAKAALSDIYLFPPSVNTDSFKGGDAFVELQIRQLFTTHFLGGAL